MSSASKTHKYDSKTVTKPGYVYEYGLVPYSYDHSIGVLVSVLSNLEPDEGAEAQVIYDRLVAGEHDAETESMYKLDKMLTKRINELTPCGMYFGRPNTDSQLFGFWPVKWLYNNDGFRSNGLSDTIAKLMGPCTFDFRSHIAKKFESDMTVVKIGIVHDLDKDAYPDYVEHTEALIDCLETLAPNRAAQYRSRFEPIKSKPLACHNGDSLEKISRHVTAILDEVSPKGMYFGTPS